MKLTPAKGNMYPWCDYTSNPLAGKCPNNCHYCYMKGLKGFSAVKRKYSGPLRLHMETLKAPTGEHKVRRREELPFVPDDHLVIFVCSGNDLGRATHYQKVEIIKDCWMEPQHFYLFQSKTPAGFKEVEKYFPPNTILGTTVETNRSRLTDKFSDAPTSPQQRIKDLSSFQGLWKMVSIEPKMKCDPEKLANLVMEAEPDFVSVGADRGGKHNLPEPNRKSILKLIQILGEVKLVFTKENLERLVRLRN